MAEKQQPLSGVEATDKGTRALGRLRERFQVEELPAALNVLAGTEAGVNDLYMNLNRQLSDGEVTEKTKLLVAVGVAAGLGSDDATSFFSQAAINVGWSKEEVLDAIGIATTCTVFNGYYRFRHQIPEDWRATYSAFKAPFNANSFMKSRIEGKDMEAICVAVSSVNGCHMCVEGHGHKAKSLGLSDAQIDEIIKAGAVANAAVGVMSALAPAVGEKPVEA